ncbi:MAG: DUF5681 domain-containing protein [Holosporales bacterium]
METVNTDEIQGRFKKGQSGNPAGKPRGARHKTTLAVQALLDGEAEGLTRKAIEMAQGGDITALRLCLERIAPARRDSTVQMDMPPVTTAADSSRAVAALLDAVVNGEITPSEGGEIAKLVACYGVVA